MYICVGEGNKKDYWYLVYLLLFWANFNFLFLLKLIRFGLDCGQSKNRDEELHLSLRESAMQPKNIMWCCSRSRSNPKTVLLLWLCAAAATTHGWGGGAEEGNKGVNLWMAEPFHTIPSSPTTFLYSFQISKHARIWYFPSGEWACPSMPC